MASDEAVPDAAVVHVEGVAVVVVAVDDVVVFGVLDLIFVEQGTRDVKPVLVRVTTLGET